MYVRFAAGIVVRYFHRHNKKIYSAIFHLIYRCSINKWQKNKLFFIFTHFSLKIPSKSTITVIWLSNSVHAQFGATDKIKLPWFEIIIRWQSWHFICQFFIDSTLFVFILQIAVILRDFKNKKWRKPLKRVGVIHKQSIFLSTKMPSYSSYFKQDAFPDAFLN